MQKLITIISIKRISEKVDTSGVPVESAFIFYNLIYAIILAPLCEELTYRLPMIICIRVFKNPYLFITLSSIIFGFMHDGTFGVFQATMAGFILGFIAYKYGLMFSLILHVLNNAIVYPMSRTVIS